MQIRKLLVLKSLAIMLFAVCLQTPECHAKGNPSGKALKKAGKAVGGSMKKAKKLLGDVKKILKLIFFYYSFYYMVVVKEDLLVLIHK